MQCVVWEVRSSGVSVRRGMGQRCALRRPSRWLSGQRAGEMAES